MTVKLLTFGVGVLLFACSQAPSASAVPIEATTGDMTAASPTSGREPGKANKRERGSGKQHEAAGFSVPFVWETSKDDPLAIARGHLKAMLTDNVAHSKGRQSSQPKLAKSSPRSTVLTCADAAVQVEAIDATPEHDVFVVRNWGNVVEPALGSIAYGIEHLGTPVLLIVGHTGCDAVKAAMGDPALGDAASGGVSATGPASKALASQLRKVAVATNGETPKKDPVVGAVLHNINEQVAKAVKLYRPLVHTGTLTVVGALYDSHNALKRGPRRLSIVNVNTVTDPQAMQAFVTALTHDDKIVTHGSESIHDERDEDAVEPQPAEAPNQPQLHGSTAHSKPALATAHSHSSTTATPQHRVSASSTAVASEASRVQPGPAPRLPQIHGLEASLVAPTKLVPRED